MQQGEGYEKKEKNPMIRYMIYMLIITVTVTGVSLSRYASSSSMIHDARAAKFDVTAVLSTSVTMSYGDYDDVSAHVLNGSKEYIFKVTNNSEVAVKARLVIDSKENTVRVNGAVTTASDWFNLAIDGSQNVTVTVVGSVDGNDVKLHVESEQLDS